MWVCPGKGKDPVVVQGNVRQVSRELLNRRRAPLGGQEELAALVSMLLEAGGSRDRSGIERALIAIALRLENPDASAVVVALGRADNTTMPHLLTVLSRVGDSASLAAVCSELDNSNPDVRKAAIRALAVVH